MPCFGRYKARLQNRSDAYSLYILDTVTASTVASLRKGIVNSGKGNNSNVAQDKKYNELPGKWSDTKSFICIVVCALLRTCIRNSMQHTAGKVTTALLKLVLGGCKVADQIEQPKSRQDGRCCQESKFAALLGKRVREGQLSSV